MNKQELLDKIETLASKTRWARHLCAREDMDFLEFMQYVEKPEEGKGYLAYRGVKLHNYWLHEHLDEILEAVNQLKEEVSWIDVKELKEST